MKKVKLKIITKNKRKEEKQNEIHKEILDKIEEQINEGIKNGSIPVVTYKKRENSNYAIDFEEKVYQLKEDEANYNYLETTKKNEESSAHVHNKQDKIMKTSLNDINEISIFLKRYLHIDIPKEELEKYISSFITKNFKAKESDVVYKVKNKNVFFLIEHQSTVDRKMPYRIYEYSHEIMKEAIDVEKEGKANYLYPKVIPIVIYTGSKKWNISTSLSDVQEKIDGYFEEANSYKLINANGYSKEELLEDDSMVSKIMLIEREEKAENVIEIIEEVATKLKENQKELLYTIIQYAFSDITSKEQIKQVLRKLKEKGGKGKMNGLDKLYLSIKEAKIEGKLEVVKNMLKQKLSIEDISRLTGISIAQIKKVRNY